MEIFGSTKIRKALFEKSKYPLFEKFRFPESFWDFLKWIFFKKMEISWLQKSEKPISINPHIHYFEKYPFFNQKFRFIRETQSENKKVVIFLSQKCLKFKYPLFRKIIHKMAISKIWMKLTSPSISFFKMWIFLILKILG